jgi:hypothetical protein
VGAEGGVAEQRGEQQVKRLIFFDEKPRVGLGEVVVSGSRVWTPARVCPQGQAQARRGDSH